MKNTLERRIILFSFLVLFVTILANAGLDIVAFRRDYVNALVMRSLSLGAAMKTAVEKVLNLGVDITSLEGMNEKCKEVVDTNREIAYCVITDTEGKPQFANHPSYRGMNYLAIEKSLTTRFDERVHLIGSDKQRYYNTINHIRTSDGKVVGQVHVGFNARIVAEKVAAIIIRSLLVLLASFVIAFSLVVLFVKRSIMQPVATQLTGVKKNAAGHFDTRIEEIKVYEFNELARDVNVMSSSLQARDEELQRNYQELESTHRQLRDSFQQLESLSHELEKSEHLYKSLMEDSSDAIVVLGDDEVVKMVNKMAGEFFGYTAPELVGLPLTKLLLLLNIENVPRIRKVFREALGGRHIAEELSFVNKDGKTVIGRVNATSIRGGAQRQVQAIFRDITREREILDNLSKSAADLARLNKMKDSFLGLASHELKTPLTVIMGYSELITTDMTDKMDPSVLEMVQNIANAAQRLDSIVKDMVDVSLIDEKRLQLKLDTVSVNRLVEAAVNELRFFFTMRKQELALNLDESIPPIKGDSIRLMQLLSNVLGNAIKFTPDGGKVSISTSAKYLLRSMQPLAVEAASPVVNIGREHHLYVEITVADTGIGIDREDQVRIFEKFYEAGNIEEHSSGKVAFKAKGAGLGLAIAKGIVEMHGGEIWVESPGYHPDTCPGSSFHILLPLNPFTGDGTLDYLTILK